MASYDCFSDFRSYPPLEPLDPFNPLNPGRRRPMPNRPFEANRKCMHDYPS